MRRGPRTEPVSARALARLRTVRGAGWVPSRDSLGLGLGAGRAGREGDPADGTWWDDGGEADPDVSDAVGPDDDRGRHRRRVTGPLVRAPAAVVGARWQPGRAAVVGVVLVTVLAVLVLGLRVAWAREAGGDPVADVPTGTVGVTDGPAAPAEVGSATPSPSASGVVRAAAPGTDGTGGAAGADAAGAAEVVVHVVGEVHDPGVQHLPAGSRVEDAVDAAGGATGRADLGLLNLARVLVDGEQVRVPRPGEVVTPPPVPGGSAGAGSAGGTTGGAGAPVSLNGADVAALDTLPGIGPVLAQRIVDWRTENGRFASVDELAEVSGIGEKLLANLRPLVTL